MLTRDSSPFEGREVECSDRAEPFRRGPGAVLGTFTSPFFMPYPARQERRVDPAVSTYAILCGSG
ncbi:hypothetical protein MES5069_670007 [Mesorhizobium escarrei]|uniref:Uncharacterized protein n=1 Tax=Mesorhizobium escarrei TaxID=666018 RepID=A0ABM9EFY9_9HYPH|nr:hypothetical protein MES5069_670007 [Mesorhizobium escarrei]